MPLIPINASLAVSDAVALDSGGSFYGGSTQFNFGSGSQTGAPVYQTTSPTVTPDASATAAVGGPAVSGSGASASGALGISDTTLIAVGLALALGAFVLLHRHKG